MSFQSEIRFIEVEEARSLRQRVLRPQMRAEECVLPGDDAASTFHLGLFHNQKLLVVASFMQESSPHFSAGFPHRLRGMATEEFYRGQGLGGKVLQFGINILKERRGDLVWCHARVRAIPFYLSMGFHPWGDLFEVKDLGPHKLMYKVLIPR